MLRIDHLTKQYRHDDAVISALQDINFTVHSAEFIAVIGPSGCGKSTLLRILAGLETHTAGDLIFKNKKTKTSIGFIAQSYALFPWLTVAQNIAFGLKLKKMPTAEIDRLIKKYLLVTGLTAFKDLHPYQLSGGMQQRVAIVRTLATNPDIILMDEPFGALDVQTRSQMQEFLVKIFSEANGAVILVTHDIDEAIYLADRVVILSTKPGSVKEIVDIPFAKPRRPEIKNQPDFLKIKKSISYVLKSESIKSVTDEKASLSDAKDFVIGSNIWTGIAPLYLAKEKGIFARHNLDPKIATLEWSKDRLEPLRTKKVDALCTTLDSALLEMERTPGLKIYMPLDVSYGGDAIVSLSKIKKIKELKGKTIGIEQGWVSHFFWQYVLARENINIADVHLKNIKASDIGKELLLGHIDAASVQEPWLTKIKEYTEITTLKTTRDYPPLIYAVLLVQEDVLEAKKNYFNAFKKSWFESVNTLSRDAAASIKLVAPYLGMSEIELAEQLENISFINIEKDFAAAMSETKNLTNKIQ